MVKIVVFFAEVFHLSSFLYWTWKESFLLFFFCMHHYFTLSVYFVALSFWFRVLTFVLRNTPNCISLSPLRGAGVQQKPVCILACGELCPAESQYGYSIIILLFINVFMENLCYSYHFWIIISYFVVYKLQSMVN